MFFDLNLTISKLPPTGNASKKTKEQQGGQSVTYSALEVAAIEKRLDLLTHCLFHSVVIVKELNIFFQVGYTVIAFSQTVKKRVDAKTHINTLNPLLDRLRVRPGIVYLKRLNITLDQDSEKGFGLVSHIANLRFFISTTFRSTQTSRTSTHMICLLSFRPHTLASRWPALLILCLPI